MTEHLGRITLRFLASPNDVTASGTSVQAGRVLEWIDKAAYACAVGWSGSYCVTAYVGNVQYSQPIAPGALVEVEARIIHTGRSSMQLLVVVKSADARDGALTAAMHCIVVMVAMDDDRRPRPVPQWIPDTDRERELAGGAVARIEARKQIHDRMRAQAYTEQGTAPRIVLRFLAAPTDVNWGGNAHGGIVMRWIDEAAYTCAARWSTGDPVAVYSGGIHFYRPIHIGDLVEVEARLIHTSSRSMHIVTHVRAGDPRSADQSETTQCMSVFVVPGADGRALPIAEWHPVSAEDVRLDAHARELITLRTAIPKLPLFA